MSNYNKILTAPAINITQAHLKILRDSQANIFRHHKKKHSSYIFFEIKKDGWVEARQLFKIIADGTSGGEKDDEIEIRLTSSAEQINPSETEDWKTKEIIGIYLTMEGYDRLKLSSFAPMDKTFIEPESSIEKIKKGFETNDEDDPFTKANAMIMIASGNNHHKKIAQKTIIEKMGLNPNDENPGNSYFQILKIQEGELKTDKDKENDQKSKDKGNNNSESETGTPLESNPKENGGLEKKGIYRGHFGYIDGISQPKFFPKDKGDGVSISPNSVASLETVLVPDLGGESKDSSYGSFLTFLKLQQNTKAFESLLEKIKNQLKGEYKSDKEYYLKAKAIIMGRYPNGASVLRKDKKDEINTDNNFSYDELVMQDGKLSKDIDGFGCPHFAHVRKANQRNINSKYSNRNKIARRGVSYSEGEGGNEKGLLFQSFQRDLKEQFELLITEMLHSPKIDGMHTGTDILTGKGSDIRVLAGKKEAIVPVDSLVTYLGGIYLFAPSISFFKNILNFHPHTKMNEKMVSPPPKKNEKEVPESKPMGLTPAQKAKNEEIIIKVMNEKKIKGRHGNIFMKKTKLGDHRDAMIKAIIHEFSPPPTSITKRKKDEETGTKQGEIVGEEKYVKDESKNPTQVKEESKT